MLNAILDISHFFILGLYILSCIHRELLLINFDADLSFKILLLTEKKIKCF
jgi:hypothetical protein